MPKATCDLCGAELGLGTTVELLTRYHLHDVEIVCNRCHNEIVDVIQHVDDIVDQFVARTKVRAVGAWIKNKLGLSHA